MSETNFRQIFFYEFKLGRNATETARNIVKVWAKGSVGESTMRTWYREFRAGDFDLEVKEGRGRPVELGEDKLKQILVLVEANPRTTIRELAEKLGVGKTIISDQLKRIGFD